MKDNTSSQNSNEDPPPRGVESDPETRTEFAAASIRKTGYTDGRELWDWKSRYSDARCEINLEAAILVSFLLLFLILGGGFCGLGEESYQIVLAASESSSNSNTAVTSPLILDVNFRLLALFFAGCVGGTTFSIKWLVHSVAKGKWHLDRRYWRLMVPFLGGVYACVLLTFLDAGFMNGGHAATEPGPIATSSAFAFLVGYFSDGVSGLLSNIANAVFGTLEKK